MKNERRRFGRSLKICERLDYAHDDLYETDISYRWIRFCMADGKGDVLNLSSR